MATKTLTIPFTPGEVSALRVSAVIHIMDRLYYWSLLLKPESTQVNIPGIMDLLSSRSYNIPYMVDQRDILQIQSLTFESPLTIIFSAEGKDNDDKEVAEILDELRSTIEQIKQINEPGEEAQAQAASELIARIATLPISDDAKRASRDDILYRILQLRYILGDHLSGTVME